MDKFIAIKSFVEVTKQNSFTEAAKQLQIGRLQVSRHVQELESWLHQRLLHRTTRQVSLTPAGQTALRYFERIMDEFNALQSQAQAQSTQLYGELRIASPIGFANQSLLPIVEGFTHEHPEVSINILASDKMTDLVADRVDIALRFTELPDENLIARKLLQLGALLCASPRYLEKHGNPTHPKELIKHNCLIHMDSVDWQFQANEENFTVKVSGNVKANSVEILLNSALHDHGIVKAPYDIAAPYIESGQLIPVLSSYTNWHFSLWAVYLSRSYQTPRVRRFIDFLVQTLQEQDKHSNLSAILSKAG
ncbi:LysR family transcriptional regulator [Pseudoalteromonas sp. MSK9-3]|uniref:LysR family transcriptional regulator n=1 Tax=Pseudoalteromonas sp. MSK9-3 TaxID=1897633 RepID=UPI000E6BC4CD|nr:LysR family transcriptional regulator [Pseudoalteromonas sp. MSK9-3]RJE77184.1 LysR family transcriptional regulator [Pseudoalteromonas sp. MSK9-3]